MRIMNWAPLLGEIKIYDTRYFDLVDILSVYCVLFSYTPTYGFVNLIFWYILCFHLSVMTHGNIIFSFQFFPLDSFAHIYYY